MEIRLSVCVVVLLIYMYAGENNMISARSIGDTPTCENGYCGKLRFVFQYTFFYGLSYSISNLVTLSSFHSGLLESKSPDNVLAPFHVAATLKHYYVYISVRLILLKLRSHFKTLFPAHNDLMCRRAIKPTQPAYHGKIANRKIFRLRKNVILFSITVYLFVDLSSDFFYEKDI